MFIYSFIVVLNVSSRTILVFNLSLLLTSNSWRLERFVAEFVSDEFVYIKYSTFKGNSEN